MVDEFFLLQAGEAGGLREGQGLVRLHLAADFRKEAGDEAAEEYRWRNAGNTIRKILELRLVSSYCPFLHEFAQCPCGVFVLRRGKPGLQSLD